MQPLHGATNSTIGAANHRGSQKKGHDALFERYHISVASIIREYTQDDRMEAPADSNQFLGIK